MEFPDELALLSYFLPEIDRALIQSCALSGVKDWQEGLRWIHDKNIQEKLNRERNHPRHRRLCEVLTQRGVRSAVIGSVDYPKPFSMLESPPVALWFRGEPIWNSHSCLAVVGSRNPSPASLGWLNWHFAEFLKSHNICIVSGGANGIDRRAHALSVAMGKPTVAWMPVGILERYPYSFRSLEEGIIAGGGAVVSPFPPDWPIYKSNFVARNELIAAQSELLFVVEARLRSGSMLTAQFAGRLGKPIGTLPSFPLDQGSIGNLDLLANGAALIRDQKDLSAVWSLACPQQLLLA